MRIITKILAVSIFPILLSQAGPSLQSESGVPSPVGTAKTPALDSTAADPSGISDEQGNGSAVALTTSSSEVSPQDANPGALRKDQVISFTVTEQVKEGKSGKAVITLKYPEKGKIKFKIQSGNKGLINPPASVTMAAGATKCEFKFSTTSDKKLNLTRGVDLRLFIDKDLLQVKRVIVTDDEKPPVLKLQIPAQLIEGQAQSTGVITLNKPADVDFKLTLKSDPAGLLETPGQVLVRAGVKSVKFKIRAVDDTLIEEQMVGKIIVENAGIASVSAVTTIIDDEVKTMKFTLPAVVTEGAPALGTVRLSGVITYDLVVKLQNDGADRLELPAEVTIPAGADSVSFPLVARDISSSDETHVVSITGTAPEFATEIAKTEVRETAAAGRSRTIPLATTDLIWDATRGKFYASVPSTAGPPYGNHVVTIDPATLEVTASVAIDQEPGKLALTSNGEALYVAQDGNGRISKITLPDFNVASSFAVGIGLGSRILYAADMCPVLGQPDLLVVAQKTKIGSSLGSAVAVYDHGVPLIQKADGLNNCIEPSADPAIFFGYNSVSSAAGLRRFQLGATGMTLLESKGGLVEKPKDDIHSDGDMIFSNLGIVVDGKKMTRSGFLPFGGLVCPELAKDRVYVLKTDDLTAVKIVACNPANFLPIQEAALGKQLIAPETFIRWGGSGFALRGPTEVTLVEKPDLVPSGPPADLAVTMVANPAPAMVGAPLTYSISATNQGPNIARGTVVSVALSDSQTITSVAASHGDPSVSGLTVNLSAGDFASGETKTLTIVTSPVSAGPLSGKVAAYSRAIDPVGSNNTAVAQVVAGFQSTPNGVNPLRLAANNLLYDSTRAVFWASIPVIDGNPLSGSVVSINPLTGAFSAPLPLGANPYPGAMALSSNGRYLYLGLSDVAAVHRIDLATSGYPSLRISLSHYLSLPNYARDIEMLEGDGTSFIVAGTANSTASVYDGEIMRPEPTDSNSVERIEPSGTPGIYIGNYGSSLTRLSVTASGIAVVSSNPSVITTYNSDIAGSGGTILAASGHLVDSASLALIVNLRSSGAPCVDSVSKRAYLATSDALQAFDTTTGDAIGSMTMPFANGKALKCIRWGTDGFGVLTNDGKIYVARWSVVAGTPVGSSVAVLASIDAQSAFSAVSALSSVIDSAGWLAALQVSEMARRVPGGRDSDNYGISDDLEYLTVTSSTVSSEDPSTESLITENGARVHLKFTRPLGVRMPAYHYEISSGRRMWKVSDAVEETVVSTQVVDGIGLENVEASVSVPSVEGYLVRLRWDL